MKIKGEKSCYLINQICTFLWNELRIFIIDIWFFFLPIYYISQLEGACLVLHFVKMKMCCSLWFTYGGALNLSDIHWLFHFTSLLVWANCGVNRLLYRCPCNSFIFNISSVFVCRFVLNNQLNVAGSCSKSLIYFMKVMTWNWCSLLFTFCLSSNNMILSLDRRGNFFWKGVDLVLPESQYLRCVQQAKS